MTTPSDPERWTRLVGGPRRTLKSAGFGNVHVYVIQSSLRSDRRYLVFESDAKMRRVRDFPADWHDLSDGDLEALSQRL